MTLIKVGPTSEDLQENEDTPEAESAVTGVFQPVSVYLRVSGFWMKRARGRSRLVTGLELVNVVLTRILLVFNVGRYSTTFLEENRFDGSLMGSVSLFLLFLWAALISFIMQVPIYTGYDRFVKMLTSYISEHGNPTYLAKMKFKIRMLVGFGLVVDLVYLVVMSEGVHTLFPSLRRHLTPVHEVSGPYHAVVLTVYALLLLAVGMTLFSLFILFIIMTYCLKLEFLFFNTAFKDELEKGEANFLDKFDNFRNRHERLCELTEAANGIQSHFAASLYFFGIPIVCCLLYGIINRSLPIDDAVFNSWNLMTVVFYMATVTGMASTLNVRISLFVARLTVEKIGYSVHGLFTIERSTILMICGTILTYAVVVLQFQPDPQSTTCQLPQGINISQFCTSL